jgi:hypothetical protein
VLECLVLSLWAQVAEERVYVKEEVMAKMSIMHKNKEMIVKKQCPISDTNSKSN